MKGILSDVNLEGQWARVFDVLESEVWADLWADLNLTVETFASVGLPENAPDDQVWFTCQQRELVLVTANRNHRGADSLEATIRAHNVPTALPVMTIADADRAHAGGAYTARVAIRLLQYLFDIDNVRGAGRLYLP